jgi:hypothetical protein
LESGTITHWSSFVKTLIIYHSNFNFQNNQPTATIMKKMHFYTIKMLLLVTAAFVFNGCVKDSAWQHYTIYRPLYKTLAQVQSELKSSTPVAIKEPGKLFTIGNYIFLNEKHKGIHIIDNSNPASPVNKAFISIPGNEDVAVYGNTLYADCFTNLFTIDITNPMQATLTKTTAGIFPDRNFVNGFAIDSAHIIYDWMAKDTTVKIALPDFGNGNNSFIVGGTTRFDFSSSSVASLSTNKSRGQGGSMARFGIVNDYLYTVTSSSINVLSLAQPQQPQFQNKVSIGFGIETIYPFQDKLFIGSTTGMLIYSVANAQAPVRLGAFSHATKCDPVITDGQYAYVTLRSGNFCGGSGDQLDVVNVQNLNTPSLVRTYPMTNPRGLSKDGQWLFICDGKDGLKCFDATSASNVVLKKRIAMAETYDVICNNNLAIVSAVDGLYQYDYSNINDIKLLSTTAWKK